MKKTFIKVSFTVKYILLPKRNTHTHTQKLLIMLNYSVKIKVITIWSLKVQSTEHIDLLSLYSTAKVLMWLFNIKKVYTDIPLTVSLQPKLTWIWLITQNKMNSNPNALIKINPIVHYITPIFQKPNTASPTWMICKY